MSEGSFNNSMGGADTDCEIYGSELCEWLTDKTGCDNCGIRALKTDRQKKEALDRWRETLSLLPSDIDTLHNTDNCVFCKGTPQKANGYAFVEMAHAEPYSEKGMILGFGKVRCDIGSLLGVQAAICRDCRSKIRLAELLPVFTVVLSLLAALLIMLIPALGARLSALGELWVMFFLAVIIIAGYLIGTALRRGYLNKISQSVHISVADIPVFNKMLNNGWFFFHAQDNIPKFSFSKRKQYRRIRSGRLDNTAIWD